MPSRARAARNCAAVIKVRTPPSDVPNRYSDVWYIDPSVSCGSRILPNGGEWELLPNHIPGRGLRLRAAHAGRVKVSHRGVPVVIKRTQTPLSCQGGATRSATAESRHARSAAVYGA